MPEERICVRVAELSRFTHYQSVPCAECGAPVVHNEREPSGFRFVCMQCLDAAAVESVDQVDQAHAFRDPGHCATCNLEDPARPWRRERPGWNGRW